MTIVSAYDCQNILQSATYLLIVTQSEVVEAIEFIYVDASHNFEFGFEKRNRFNLLFA